MLSNMVLHYWTRMCVGDLVCKQGIIPLVNVAGQIQWLVLVFIVVTLIFAAMLIIGGTYTSVMYGFPPSKTTQMLAHKYDTILLESGVDIFSYSDVIINQCVKVGDDYHDSNIYAIKTTDVKVKVEPIQIFSPLLGGDEPSYKAGLQDYLYLLPDSEFVYRICMASTTVDRQTATFFLFDSLPSYWEYVDDQDNGQDYSILSQTVYAGGNNDSKCTEISYTVTHPSYYFMMIHTPANVLFTYNLTLSKRAYDTSDNEKSCVVSDSDNCEIPLRGTDFHHVKYDIIAYIQPVYLERSILTHLCVASIGGSSSLQKLKYISLSSIGLGAVIGLALVVLLIVMPKCRSNRVAAERQRLLDHY